MKIVLLPLALLPLVGCRNPAPGYTPAPSVVVEPVKPAEIKTPLTLMPLELGNQWTYALRIETYQGQKLVGAGDRAVDYRVAKVKPDGTAVVILEEEGTPIDQQVWRSTSDGLYQVASGLESSPYSPEQPLALLPLTAGRRFTWSGRGPTPDGKVAQARMTSEILAPQSVDTNLGPLSSVPVETLTTYGKSEVRTTSWFRPGVGLIRIRQETSAPSGQRQIFLLTLTNYAIKRQ